MSGIQTVILCGGRGTRLREYTEAIPKVLVEVGGYPILWHIMKGYAAYGFDDFVLALGYLADRVKAYVDESVERPARSGAPGSKGRQTGAHARPASRPGGSVGGWSVAAIDTGEETNTGGRIKRLQQTVTGPTFFATYGDGVSDIDLRSLLSFHRAHGKAATLTVVRPQLNFGLVELEDDDRVRCFTEKPRMDGWINGGFFVFDRRVFDYLEQDSVLEREPMERLASDGQLMAFRHDGFWACMDTYKDNLFLNQSWSAGNAAWKTWD
jgi:glucose-1-phosphate cytidylyltransferase